MCVKKIQRCTSLIAKYWQRKMPTTVHREKWLEFEALLNWRSNVGLILNIIFNVIAPLTDSDRVKLSKKYMESG